MLSIRVSKSLLFSFYLSYHQLESVDVKSMNGHISIEKLKIVNFYNKTKMAHWPQSCHTLPEAPPGSKSVQS